jgi:hypothetical protein
MTVEVVGALSGGRSNTRHLLGIFFEIWQPSNRKIGAPAAWHRVRAGTMVQKAHPDLTKLGCNLVSNTSCRTANTRSCCHCREICPKDATLNQHQALPNWNNSFWEQVGQ